MSNETTGLDDTDSRAEELTDEIAKKYDPERLLKMVSRRAGRGQSLEHSVRAKYERRFGVDLGHVRVYTGEFAEEFNRQRNAYAVTVGSTGMILMGGSPDKSMASASGQALLAHELTHVAQAKRGLHNKNFSGAMPLATEEHEQEAEQVEQQVAAGQDGDEHAAGGDTRSAADAGAAAVATKEAVERALEQIRERVYDLAADAARTHYMRNSQQRPSLTDARLEHPTCAPGHLDREHLRRLRVPARTCSLTCAPRCAVLVARLTWTCTWHVHVRRPRSPHTATAARPT